jgi:hypothetical protein
MHQALKAAGWQPSVGYWPPHSGYHRTYNDSAWTLDWRILSRHQYKGVNSDNAIRIRQSSGMRMGFHCAVEKPSRLLITTVSSVTFIAWLFDKILKLKGFRRSKKTIGINRVYHQDSQMANKLLSHSDFLVSAQQLSNCDTLVSWELELLPGHLSINLTTSPNINPDAEMLSCLFQMVLSLRQQLGKIPCFETHKLSSVEKNASKTGAKSLKQLNWFRVESWY